VTNGRTDRETDRQAITYIARSAMLKAYMLSRANDSWAYIIIGLPMRLLGI